jgi:2-methylisocitrate lyase-like PEP mutase family enzyme
MPGSFRQIIDKAVADKRFLVVPGAHDALSARLIQAIGFETYFIGGFPAVGARYGVPDVGLKGFSEIAAAVRDIMAACDLPVFVDGDDGYGDVKNVVHTVQGYERMGVSAILIEDRVAEALRSLGGQESGSGRTRGGEGESRLRGAP